MPIEVASIFEASKTDKTKGSMIFTTCMPASEKNPQIRHWTANYTFNLLLLVRL